MGTTGTHGPGRRAARERGQALAELALITPILVLLLAAIFQFAFVFETQMGITNAVREAARRAAAAENPDANWVEGQLCTNPACTSGLLPENVQGFAGSRLSPTSPEIDFCTYTVGSTSNQRITVTVTYHHPEFFPLAEIAGLAAGHAPGSAMVWDVTASAQMRLENPLASAPSGCS